MSLVRAVSNAALCAGLAVVAWSCGSTPMGASTGAGGQSSSSSSSSGSTSAST